MSKKKSNSQYKSSFKKRKVQKQDRTGSNTSVFPDFKHFYEYIKPFDMVRQFVVDIYNEPLEKYPEVYNKYIKSEEQLKKLIKDRYNELVESFSQKIDHTGFVDIYRAVKADSIYDVNFIGGVGVYWSYEKDWAISYFGEEPMHKDEGGEFRFVITAKVRAEDVNWLETLQENLFENNEKEIILDSGTPIRIFKVQQKVDSQYIDHEDFIFAGYESSAD
jgi:hypothetical protein